MRRLGFAILVLSLISTGWAVEIEGLRVWAGPEKTRTVVDLSASTEYRVFTLQQPHRVVIDLQRSVLKPTFGMPSLRDEPLLAGVRTGRRGSDDLRIVFDLRTSAQAKSFLLRPTEPYGHRLVIDLYPDTGREDKTLIKTIPRNVRGRPVVVAIDAGHGGEDPGAIGPQGTREKDVVLAIAQTLANELGQQPGVETVLVRDGDYYIPHLERPAKARAERADLFVSIHADAFHDRRVRGSSVFVLSQKRASSEAAKWLADRENRADLVGGVSLDDKDDTLAAVLLDLSQSASIEVSSQVAKQVFQSIGQVAKTHSQHVEGAPFAVLTAPDIPSLLVETAFISNPQEEANLNSPRWRLRIASAIAEGVMGYFYSNPPAGTWLAQNRIDGSHTVVRGETLSEIAKKHRVSLTQLRVVNDLEGDLVRTGSVLRIPSSPP